MSAGTYRIGVLGPLFVQRDGVAVPLSSGRQRSLLGVLLAAHGVPVSRDRLIEEVWGENAPPTAVSTLHVHLSKLRSTLGDLLVLQPGGYVLAGGRFVLDVAEFDALVAEARAEPERTIALLSAALELFRGEPLCDIAAEGAVAQWQRELSEKRLAVIVTRIDAELAAGAGRQLIPELERLVAEHRFEERLWGQLMLALHRSDRQADALDAYQRARRLFAGELGLEPGESLARLQQQILERDPALHAAPAPGALTAEMPTTEAAPAPPDRRRSSGVPIAPTRLVGRQHELEWLAAEISDPAVRVLTLTGTGGVGKTRLALELARQQEPSYADGALFVRLDQVADPGLIAAEIATTLARRDRTTGLGPDRLVNDLRDRELLLVLDNFEHLLPAAPLVTELVSMAPQLRVLVTSRAALRVRGEHVLELEPLPLPAEDDSDLEANPAVGLFVQCARAGDRQLRIDESLLSAGAVICRALDGLPLAIELAASRLRTLPLQQIAAQLEAPLTVGEHGLRDLPTRQQTLHNTIRWSYDLLSGDEQETLRCAAVFSGGFTQAAVDAVAGRSCVTEVESLLEASLLRRVPGTQRFALLVLVRAFALEALQQDGQTDRLRARHRAYFADLVVPVSTEFDRDGFGGELAAALHPDHANLLAALEDSFVAGDAECATALALGLRSVWLADMLRHEANDLIGRLLDRFTISARDEVMLLRTASGIEGQVSHSSEWTRRLAARAAEVGDHDGEIRAIVNLFSYVANRRDVGEMENLGPRLEELCLSETRPRNLFGLHHALSAVAYVSGDLDSAVTHLEACVGIAEELGNPYLVAGTSLDALFYTLARDGEIARDPLARALELVRATTTDTFFMYALWLVARYAAPDTPQDARRWLAHAERIRIDDDIQLWPESIVRDETLAILGLTDASPLLAAVPALTPAQALAQAASWLAA